MDDLVSRLLVAFKLDPSVAAVAIGLAVAAMALVLFVLFVDDLNLQAVDVKESEADEWALEAAIPREIWESSSVRERPTPIAVVQFANKLHIHPAIVAGRIRFERKNFRMLSHYVGRGEIRRHFTQ